MRKQEFLTALSSSEQEFMTALNPEDLFSRLKATLGLAM